MGWAFRRNHKTMNPYTVPQYPKWLEYSIMLYTKFEKRTYWLMRSENGISFGIQEGSPSDIIMDLSEEEAEYIVYHLPEYLMESLL